MTYVLDGGYYPTKKKEDYYLELSKIPFNILRSWCIENLAISQRKELFRRLKSTGDSRNTVCYLYTIEGVFIDKFESFEDAQEQLEIILNKKISKGYIATCSRIKRPFKKTYWITNSYPFDKKEYNNNNLVTKRKKYEKRK